MCRSRASHTCSVAYAKSHLESGEAHGLRGVHGQAALAVVRDQGADGSGGTEQEHTRLVAVVPLDHRAAFRVKLKAVVVPILDGHEGRRGGRGGSRGRARGKGRGRSRGRNSSARRDGGKAEKRPLDEHFGAEKQCAQKRSGRWCFRAPVDFLLVDVKVAACLYTVQLLRGVQCVQGGSHAYTGLLAALRGRYSVS